MTASDPDLKRAFDGLRSAEVRAAPSFADLTAPQALNLVRRRHRVRRLQAGAALGSGSLLLALIALGPDPRPPVGRNTILPGGIDLNSVYWRAPSDFLLETPGRDLLRSLPRFTTIGEPVTAPDPSPADESARNTERRPRT
jgi:hypothetical protein